MLITVNRTYEIHWLDGWNGTGWHLIKSYSTLEDAIKCIKEESKKQIVRLIIIDTPIDNSLIQTYMCYEGWKD